jgi:RNA 2',3'-cyclic 3'-phosphodiesterase
MGKATDRPPQTRTFVALELPEDLRLSLGTLQFQFGASAQTARWVAPELLHVTMRFLGELPPERLDLVERAARAAAFSTEPFSLDVGRLGAFPNERNPRVLWVGLQGDAGLASLQQLHTALENGLANLGCGREDKPFSPHITVARTRERAGPEARRALGAALVEIRSHASNTHRAFPVHALTVMRSDLHSGRPRYTPLARLPLGVARSTVDAGVSVANSEET